MSGLASLRSSAVVAAHRASRVTKLTPAGTSQSFPQYLAQRNGVYYFKRKVPAALAAAFGTAQVWKSLETQDYREASLRLPRAIADFELRVAVLRQRAVAGDVTVSEQPFQMTSRRPLLADMIPALLQRYTAHMLQGDDEELREMRPLRPADLAERRADIEETLAALRMAHITDDFTAVEETVAQLLDGEGLKVSRPSALWTQLCRELLATEMRILQEQLARLQGIKSATPEAPVAIRLLPTLRDYLAFWSELEQRPRRTLAMTEYTVRRWEQLMGELPAAYISRADVKRFRDQLEAQELAAATIRNRLGLLRAIVGAYHTEHDMRNAVNPFEHIQVKDKGQGVRVKKERRAFEMFEMNRLFQAAVFTHKELPRGQVGEAAFWVPLMGPFVGARIEELAQLNLADIEIINGTWAIRICKYDPRQKLKTASSFRWVPIHDELVKLGFLQYLCAQRRAGETRVFPTLRADNKHQIWSNALGKWFGRLLDSLNLTSPNIDYHSFRYSFKQRLTQCGVSIEVRDALTGHWQDGSAGKVYLRHVNRQYDFQLLCDGMRRLRYDELNLSHLYVDDPLRGVDKQLFVR